MRRANSMEVPFGTHSTQRNSLFILGAIAVLFMATGLFLYQDVMTPQQSDSKLEKIAQNPNQFVGQDVAVSGEIQNLLGSRAFALQVPGMFSDKVLVISRDPLIPVGGVGADDSFFNEEQRVRVDGQVREFRIKDLEAELGIDLVDDQFTSYEGEPFIYATSVREDL